MHGMGRGQLRTSSVSVYFRMVLGNISVLRFSDLFSSPCFFPLNFIKCTHWITTEWNSRWPPRTGYSYFTLFVAALAESDKHWLMISWSAGWVLSNLDSWCPQVTLESLWLLLMQFQADVVLISATLILRPGDVLVQRCWGECQIISLYKYRHLSFGLFASKLIDTGYGAWKSMLP